MAVTRKGRAYTQLTRHHVEQLIRRAKVRRTDQISDRCFMERFLDPGTGEMIMRVTVQLESPFDPQASNAGAGIVRLITGG